ncbi:hypothetical protein CDEST_07019 [Colletotrichum destructivum]|uniref:Uncharacterized protein n=1 Tax=Colletotrichum destructivum TaxID=34406 RepID=A0AAX4IG19_9PEZI|nr:hypothetical protein CDEST_07019 [Colletotrichum destructivum]
MVQTTFTLTATFVELGKVKSRAIIIHFCFYHWQLTSTYPCKAGLFGLCVFLLGDFPGVTIRYPTNKLLRFYKHLVLFFILIFQGRREGVSLHSHT